MFKEAEAMNSPVPFLPPGFRKHNRTDLRALVQSSDETITSFRNSFFSETQLADSLKKPKSRVNQQDLEVFEEDMHKVLEMVKKHSKARGFQFKHDIKPPGPLTEPRVNERKLTGEDYDNEADLLHFWQPDRSITNSSIKPTLENTTDADVERSDFWNDNIDMVASKDWPVIADYGYRLQAALLRNFQRPDWPNIRKAIVAYKDDDKYPLINAKVREPGFPARVSDQYLQANSNWLVNAIRNLDSAFELFPPTQSDMILWRGLKLKSEWRQDDEPILLQKKWPSYSSLSADLNTSLTFVGHDDLAVIFRVHVPAGVRLVPVSACVEFFSRDEMVRLQRYIKGGIFAETSDNENELLLPRNTDVTMDWGQLRFVEYSNLVRVIDVYVHKP